MDRQYVLIIFKDFLLKASREGKNVVVVIDEAQNLSTEVLEEVRLLTNLGQGAEQPVQLVLAGQPELKEIVNRPELAQLRQRIRVHYEVETLGFEEMVGYVNHRMDVAGCSRKVFEPEALELLYKVSGGVPRLVNTHAGSALLSAFVAQSMMVTVRDVEEGMQSGEGEHDSRTGGAKFPGTTAGAGRMARRTGLRGSGLWIGMGAVVSLLLSVWYVGFRGEQPTIGAATTLDRPAPALAKADSVPEAVITSVESQPEPIVARNPEPVVVAEPEPEPELELPAPTSEDFVYFSHVASFRDSARARAYLGRLEDRSLPGQVSKELISGREWYRVYIGPAATREAAESMVQGLVEIGEVTYYLVMKRAAG